MANNVSTLADEDGDFSDWIEIFNPDAAPLNLAGYALTDDPLVLQKWVFPSVTVPAGGYLVVFASTKNRVDPTRTLHTNFAIEQNGEYLALIAPDGVTKLTEYNLNPLPVQEADHSYGITVPLVTTTVIPTGVAARWLVPGSEIAGWNGRIFDDASWTAGHTGIGYENSPGDAVNYTALLSADSNTGAQMFNLTGTCYIRIPFNVPSAAAVASLTLKIRYDDGFIAYVNGAFGNSRNAPDGATFNSTATVNRADSSAVVFETVDLNSARTSLVDGQNVLAIQGLNAPVGSSDFLIQPTLEIATEQVGATPTAGYFPTPTPGSLNGTRVIGFVKDTKFSVDRGFRTTTFSVAITTETTGAQIRYTTDGTAPTSGHGTVYTTPISVSTTTVLRAAAFKTQWEPSNVDTQTYIFANAVKNQPAAPAGFPATWGHEGYDANGNGTIDLITADYAMDTAITGNALYTNLIVPGLTRSLPVVSITGDPVAIFGPDGLYSDGRLNSPDTEIPMSFEYFVPNPNGSTIPLESFRVNCGVRIHGGDAPFEHPKKPFRLFFRKEYGATKLEYPIYPNSLIQKFDKLQLRPGGHDGWSVPFGNTSNDLAYHATYIRDEFLRQTEVAQGRLAPHGRFVHLYINGLYWGFYNLHEVPSNDYFSSYYGGKDKDWDVLEQPSVTNSPFDIVDGDADALSILQGLCTPPTRPSDPLIYDQILDYINVDEFIDHMIVQIWAGQSDWVGPVFNAAGQNISYFFNKNWDTGRLSRGPFQSPFYFNAWDDEISMGTQINLGFVPEIFVGQRNVDLNYTRVGELGFNTILQPSTGQTYELGVPGVPGQIYNALRSNPDFRRRFGDRLQKNFFNTGPMTLTNNQARLAALRAILDASSGPAIVAESARWGDVNGIDFTRNVHWYGEMNWLKDTYLVQRTGIVLTQFQAIGLFPGITAPAYNQFGGITAANFQLAITNPNAGGGVIYYTTDGTDPYRPTGPIQTKLVQASSACKYWVPTSAVLGTTWKEEADPSNIGIWSNGSAALGFDQFTTYLSQISTNVAAMQTQNTSIYIRIPFIINDTAELNSINALTLRMKYDDGFYAYINGGTPVATANTPATQDFNSAAPNFHDDYSAVVFESIDITSQKSRLHVGTNYLCIQGLNQTTASTDFLIVPELVITTGSVAEGPSPSAQVYTAPITLPGSGPVKSRVLSNGIWSALTDATFVVGVPASSTNLVISEFNYEPSLPTSQEVALGFTSGSDFEYIEIYNPTASVVELSGVTLSDAVDFNFSNAAIRRLGPGGRVLVVNNLAAFQFRYGTSLPVAGEFQNDSALSNGGERIWLRGATGATIVDLTYNNKIPWPVPPAGSGFALVLISPESFPDESLPASWRLSRVPGGSPGFDDVPTYASWLATYSGIGNEFADGDGDGIGNLLEYALAGNPSVSSPGILPKVGTQSFTVGDQTADYMVLSFRKQAGAEDISYHPEFSTSVAVAGFQETGVFVSSTPNADGSSTEVWRSGLPASTIGQKQFARLRIVK